MSHDAFGLCALVLWICLTSAVCDPTQWDCSPVVGAMNTGDAVESSGVEANSFDVDADGLDAGDRQLRARGSQLGHSSKKLRRWGH